MAFAADARRAARMSISEKLLHLNWLLVVLLIAIACTGFAMLYSASSGSLEPWARPQIVRFSAGLAMALVVALIDVRLWLRWAYPIYLLSLALLVSVEFIGTVGMGAQRWISLGFVRLQPSEVTKIATILALARYFHSTTLEDVRRPLYLVVPVALVAVPAALVLRQPDLGTAGILLLVAACVFFLAGVRIWKFVALGVAAVSAVPFVWQALHGYQKQRILTFLNPESDPLGAGYHILQSKIALGSGGVFGKGYLHGTQSHLNFVPEKQTDFIFTMLAEELGIVGGLALIALYLLVVALGYAIALRSQNQFGRLLALGVTANFFLYVFINIAMVMGLIPVVGVPLPLISYGGTSMLSLLFGFGLILSVSIHRDVEISKRWAVTGF